MKNIVQASVIVTYRCNAKCKMCEIWKYPSKPSEEIEPKYFENFPEGLRINITGGEPMVREDIEEFFRILYPKSYLLELSTNGYFTDRIVRLAEKYPNILIRVSVEGLPALNDKQRGIQNGFDHALRTILELKKTKCKNIGFSIVISPNTVQDLISLYELCCYLDIELGNSTIHNSWYFHKMDNVISDKESWKIEEEFIKKLLRSPRRSMKGKIKDYLRAYFNLSILKRLRGDPSGYRPPCGAGTDFFFIDPYGNVTPCNGSEEEWIIGNIKEDSVQNILNSERAKNILLNKVKPCQLECCFVVTERHDMVRKPWKPIWWIIKNKIKLMFNIPLNL